MASQAIDKGRFPPTFWRAMQKVGVEPAKALRLAGLSPNMHLDASATFSTAQVFAVWKAVETLSENPTLALRLLEAADLRGHQPAFIAALYAADFRDAIGRIERFKRMGACEVFRTEETRDAWTITKDWPFAIEPEPAVSVDLSFIFLLELGRRGSGRRIIPRRVELKRKGPANPELADYFGGLIVFGSPRNAMTFHVDDLALPFPGHSPEFLDLVTPASRRRSRNSRRVGRSQTGSRRCSSAASRAAAPRWLRWRGSLA